MKNVSAVIVTFNNAEMLQDLLEDLSTQTRPLDQIVVVDNFSSDKTEIAVKENFPNVIYKRLSENMGSAGGYYEGMKIAAENSDYIWTLDDDVRMESNSLENLLIGLDSLENSHKIGAVRSVGQKHPYDVPTELAMIAWRGTLIKTDAVKSIGLPGREYFLYGEDLEYALRLKKYGYSFFWIPSSRCVERRQGKTDDIMFGRAVKIYPTTFRLYYAFRNEIYIYILYRKIYSLIKTFIYALKVIVYLLISEKIRGLKKIKAIFNGIIHGIQGRLGRDDNYLPD